MREIKFRAWDSAQGKIVENYASQMSRGEMRVLTFHETHTPSLTLMQFTGLHDKNGKEIYEGDVVKDGAGQVNVITFGAGTYWFNWLHLVDVMEPMEVIGNIYENPELLGVAA